MYGLSPRAIYLNTLRAAIYRDMETNCRDRILQVGENKLYIVLAEGQRDTLQLEAKRMVSDMSIIRAGISVRFCS